MDQKTRGVNDLFGELLVTFVEPCSEDVIEDVCVAIEQNPRWKLRYDESCTDLGVMVVNNWVGQHTKKRTGGKSLREVPATRTTLIKDYTKLAR